MLARWGTVVYLLRLTLHHWLLLLLIHRLLPHHRLLLSHHWLLLLIHWLLAHHWLLLPHHHWLLLHHWLLGGHHWLHWLLSHHHWLLLHLLHRHLLLLFWVHLGHRRHGLDRGAADLDSTWVLGHTTWSRHHGRLRHIDRRRVRGVEKGKLVYELGCLEVVAHGLVGLVGPNRL